MWQGISPDPSPPSHPASSQLQGSPFGSQFHLLPHIEAILDTLERGVRDQHLDDLVNELANRFDRCNQLLALQSAKPMTVRSQKMKLQEYEHQLNLRREALAKYSTMVDKAVNGEVSS